MTFKEVEPRPNYIKNEEIRLNWWYEHGIVDQYLHRNDESEKNYRFLDGPITANNPMGVHHAHGRTIKDFFQRYKNMQGYKQRFQNGFDCQGLWVEVEEEKDLGFDSKRDIEEFGLDKFSNSCRARVERFSDVQADQSKRLGMFMDWDNSYYTMSERNNLHIWHFLRVVHEKGWLYKGIDAMPWCTRCGTAISQHELSDGGYKDVTHESIYVKYQLTDTAREVFISEFDLAENKKISLLIWTTTPWTLLSNVAVAVNPDLNYNIAEHEDEYIVVTEERMDVLSTEENVVKTTNGKTLVDCFKDIEGDVYTGPFDELDVPSKVTHKVIEWNDVTDSDGTGLVHIAPGAGKEDFDLHFEKDLDIIESIDDFGDYLEGFGEFSGQNVFDVRGQIYDSLKKKGLFYKTASIHHSYPHCWRCKHELVFKTTAEWFISADEIRPEMKKAADEASWMPDHARKRMQDWLDNMSDWPISRKRYWGLALPFYENEDRSKFYVVKSKEELKELAIEPEKVDKLPELHRPWIDEIELDGSKIEIDGEKQSGVWKRVSDVGDCWLDAGIVPFSTVDYLTNKDWWDEWYPFDFITEYVAQVKLWFYATLFMSVTLEGKAPWKNVLATGFLVDEKGKAMHKSAGNAIAFDEAADESGADAIRWLYLRERSANHHGTGNLRFGYNILDEVRRRYLNILWNTYRYFVTHANSNDWEPAEKKKTSKNVLDKWVLARLHSVLQQVNVHLDSFNSPDAAKLLEEFVVKDFSQWYVRRSRDRVSASNKNIEDRDAFFETSYFVLKTLAKVLAPFIPFMAEEMYQNLRTDEDPQSVHLEDWPEFANEMADDELVEQMEFAREVVEKAHALRKEAGVRLRQPLQKVELVNSPVTLSEKIGSIIAEELNVKEVEYVSDPNADEFDIGLDLEMSDELLIEGAAREVMREIQKLRRKAAYDFDQQVVVYWQSDDTQVNTLFETFANDIATHTVCSLIMGEAKDPDGSAKLETEIGTIALSVVEK